MGPMRNSTISVTVRSRFAGRKFLTLEIRLSRVKGTRNWGWWVLTGVTGLD